MIRRGGQELGRSVHRTPALCAPLAHFGMRGQHTIHRALCTVIGAIILQQRIHLRRGQIDKPLGVQHVEHALRLLGRERASRHAARRRADQLLGASTGAIVRRRRDAETGAERAQRTPGTVRGDGGHERVSVGASGVGRVSHKRCENFWGRR